MKCRDGELKWISASTHGYIYVVASDSALGRNRTCDQEIRRLLLYPLSYEGMAARPASSLLVLPAALSIQVVPVLGDRIDECLRLLVLR
jgi:hypothetical protein